MHPNRSDVSRTQNAKMQAMGSPLNAAVEGDVPNWNEYSAKGAAIGNKYGYSLGAEAPAIDAANNTRVTNKDPKAFRP